MLECKKCGKKYNLLPTSDINICPVCSKKKKKKSLFILGIINILLIFYIINSNILNYFNPKAALLLNIGFYVLMFSGITIWFAILLKYYSE